MPAFCKMFRSLRRIPQLAGSVTAAFNGIIINMVLEKLLPSPCSKDVLVTINATELSWCEAHCSIDL